MTPGFIDVTKKKKRDFEDCNNWLILTFVLLTDVQCIVLERT